MTSTCKRGKAFTRRSALGYGLGAAAGPIFPALPAFAGSLPSVKAYRNPGCDCCGKWTEQMRAAGFDATIADDADLAARKSQLGVPDRLSGCHTAVIGDYIVEGHVPPEDIIRFLTGKPDARGLAVPGMPKGSPGTEMGGGNEPYDILAFKKDGSWYVYASHG